MKKLISVLVSIIAVFAVSTAFAVPAMAAINVYSPVGEVIVHEANDPTVNKKPSANVTGKQVSNGSNQITYVYTGSGNFQGWELVDKNGKSYPLSDNDPAYKIVSNNGKTLTLEILDWSYFESPDGYTVNAIVKDEVAPGKKDDSSKSPKTGAATITLASMAAAGAGAAILALKKKDAE